MAKIKVKNMAMLDEEVARLKNKSRNLEHDLATRIEHFRSNYKKMAVNSIAPGLSSSGVMGFVGGMAKTAFKSGAGKSLLTNALMTAVEFVGVRLGIKLFNNIRNKRHRKKAAARAEE